MIWLDHNRHLTCLPDGIIKIGGAPCRRRFILHLHKKMGYSNSLPFFMILDLYHMIFFALFTFAGFLNHKSLASRWRRSISYSRIKIYFPSLPSQSVFVKKLRIFNWNCVKFAHGKSWFCEFWLSHRYNFKLIVFKIYCKVFCLFMNYLFCDFKIDIELAIGVSCF